jgi:hypothetical protein
MTITMYDVSVPVFTRMLTNLSGILDGAAEYAVARKIDPAVLLSARLYPDMFPLTRQIQSSTDHANRASARLARAEIPRFPDVETTIDELKARIGRALAFVGGIDPNAFIGAEDRDVTLVTGGREWTMNGKDYFLNSALPNFFFHVTTAYNILRHNGLEIGKSNYLGR